MQVPMVVCFRKRVAFKRDAYKSYGLAKGKSSMRKEKSDSRIKPDLPRHMGGGMWKKESRRRRDSDFVWSAGCA